MKNKPRQAGEVLKRLNQPYSFIPLIRDSFQSLFARPLALTTLLLLFLGRKQAADFTERALRNQYMLLGQTDVNRVQHLAAKETLI